jgi:pimeloyl-ACP methyl ester carboxylesterase
LKKTDSLRAAAKLLTQATIGVTNIAEGVHRSVKRTMLLEKKSDSSATSGISGLVYQSIRGTTGLVGGTIDKALKAIEPMLSSPNVTATESGSYQAVLAALNGVMGDRLASDNNPLATQMSFQYGKGTATDKILLVIHGLCMNDLQWSTTHDDVPINHAETVAIACNFSTIYLRYNTGRAIEENGAELNLKLDELMNSWPIAIKEINVLVHSMGGLVVRSAVHQADQSASKSTWRKKLKRIAFLGTPHHGAPLEKAGHWIDLLLGATPYSKPFVALTKLRSAGINNLRDGLKHPLPKNVAFLAVAACTTAKRNKATDHVSGDGLVSVNSALGTDLGFNEIDTKVFFKMNHMQLLSRPEVAEQLIQFFSKKRLSQH